MEKVIVEVRDDHFIELIPGEYNMNFSIKQRINCYNQYSEHIKIEGYLTWDGYFNWKTTNNMYYCFCEQDHLKLLNECFLKIWELGKKYIEYKY